MSQTINRVYDSLGRANGAAHELRTNRFDRFDEMHVVGRPGEGDAASADAIVAALMKACVLKVHASVFAEGIRRGGTLVRVHAHFGTADAAPGILERHGPIDSRVPDVSERLPAGDEAAPCSSLLHMLVLLADSATFSRLWNVPPLLKSGATTSSALGLPEATVSRGPFAGTFGLPLISNKATPPVVDAGPAGADERTRRAAVMYAHRSRR